MDGPNPRRVVVEDRAEALADALAVLGDRERARRLREVLSGALIAGPTADAHLPALRAALHDVATSGLPAPLVAAAVRVRDAVDDLPAALGVRGSVWAGWRHVGYSPTWLDATGPLEQGPADADLATALAWARRRARVILLRPEWSQDTYYSVGPQDDPRHPRLVLP
ncbi:hypothetical protein GCM10027047_28230 [Rhodococcus aerolatus]